MRIIALFGCLAAIVGLLIPTQIFAQVSTQGTLVDEIVILGSRAKPRSAGETPAPVDFLAGEALRDTAYDEAGRALQSLAPSFNFPSTSIADGTDSLKPATLRGLGPDQTLVLVNGIRRHKSALVHVNSSVGRGTAGTDMNAIPTSFLDNIEILRDGASALYGSDAIGGVINLQLRRESSGEATFSTGET
ncbi:MAG: TonB-dependent receptor plug domain-containing protein, partial [Parvibaculales bacterium]